MSTTPVNVENYRIPAQRCQPDKRPNKEIS
jgi:hypothetical protein